MDEITIADRAKLIGMSRNLILVMNQTELYELVDVLTKTTDRLLLEQEGEKNAND